MSKAREGPLFPHIMSEGRNVNERESDEREGTREGKRDEGLKGIENIGFSLVSCFWD